MAVHLHQRQSVLTTAEAAKLFGRSASWVRDQINTGQLSTLHPYGVRPFLITKTSAQILKARLAERQTEVARPHLQIVRGRRTANPSAEASRQSRPHWLRLIIDNTGKDAR